VEEIVDNEAMRQARKEAALADLTALALSTWGIISEECDKDKGSKELYRTKFEAMLADRLVTISQGWSSAYGFEKIEVIWDGPSLVTTFHYQRRTIKDHVIFSYKVDPKAWWV